MHVTRRVAFEEETRSDEQPATVAVRRDARLGTGEAYSVLVKVRKVHEHIHVFDDGILIFGQFRCYQRDR